MSSFEIREHGPRGSGFSNGSEFGCEKESVIKTLQRILEERTKGLRTGLMIVAERKAYHAWVIERRIHELGSEFCATSSEEGAKLVDLLANAESPELEKLPALTSLIQEPPQAVAPLLTFAAALKADIQTKQALQLLAEDELSSATWLYDIYPAIRGTRAV